MENMEPIDHEAEYREIVAVLKEHNGQLDYKTLNNILSEKFEGVRLRLKTMKDREIVEFDGMVPSFDSVIRLGSNSKGYE